MQRPVLNQWPAAFAAAFLMATGLAHAQENLDVGVFDTEDEALRWTRWWGAPVQTYWHDPSVDADGNAQSGSLMAIVDFDYETYQGDNQFALVGSFADGATLNGGDYTNLVFQVRWSASSPTRAEGDFGYLEYGFRTASFGQIWLGGQTIPTSAGDTWLQIAAPIDPATPDLDAITGVVLKLWSGNAGGLTGQTMFWLDNVRLLANTNAALEPPSVRLASPVPGLRVTASGSGQYDRHNIRTQTTDSDGNPNAFSWVDAGGPVTYAFQIKEFPDASHSGFQAHLFLVPDLELPYGPGDTSIDWNAPHVIFVQITRNGEGGGNAQFMYKTNLPSGNTMFWNADPEQGPVGNLMTLSDSSVEGEWRVTFNSTTSVTLTGPGGATADFEFPAESAAFFQNPLYVYLGVQPNETANIGQHATFGGVSITGALSSVSDEFLTAELDSTKWAVVAASAAGIFQIPAGTAYQMSWDAPATGFIPESTADLETWSPIEAEVLQIGREKTVFISTEALPSPNAGFFRLTAPAVE